MTYSLKRRAFTALTGAALTFGSVACSGDSSNQGSIPDEPSTQQDNGIEIVVGCSLQPTDLSHDNFGAQIFADAQGVEHKIVAIGGSDISLVSKKDGMYGELFLTHDTNDTLLGAVGTNIVQEEGIQEVGALKTTGTFGLVPGKVAYSDPKLNDLVGVNVKFTKGAIDSTITAFLSEKGDNPNAVTLAVQQTSPVSGSTESAGTAEIIVIPPSANGADAQISTRVVEGGKITDSELSPISEDNFSLKLPNGADSLASVLVVRDRQVCLAAAHRSTAIPR